MSDDKHAAALENAFHVIALAKEALEQSTLDLSYYIHLATKAKTNNKWIDCEVYKITMSLERLEKTLSAIAAFENEVTG